MEEFTKILKNIQDRLDEQRNDLKSAKENITKTINDNIDEKFRNLEIQHQHLENKLEKQQEQLNYQDRFNRRKNLIIFGVEEEEGKGYHELENLILSLLNKYSTYKFNSNDLEFVRRLGKRSMKPRPILLTLTTMGKKIQLLKNKKHLENTPYYIQEDFPKDVLEKRKQLKLRMKEEKEKGNKAILKYDRLIIIDNKEIENRKNGNKRFMSQSPEATNTNSEENANNKNRENKKIRTMKSSSQKENDKPKYYAQNTLLSYMNKNNSNETKDTEEI